MEKLYSIEPVLQGRITVLLPKHWQGELVMFSLCAAPRLAGRTWRPHFVGKASLFQAHTT